MNRFDFSGIALKVLLFGICTIAAFLGTQSINPSVTAQAGPSDEQLECIGEELAKYLKVITNAKAAGAFSDKIKILSPAFNLTSGYEPKIYDAMVAFDPSVFNGTAGFAGNTYTLEVASEPDGIITGYEWINQQGWSAKFGSANIYLTEFGDFRTANSDPNDPGVIATMVSDFGAASGDSRIQAINYFAALTPPLSTNPEFSERHKLTNAEINQIVGGNSKAGINPGLFAQLDGKTSADIRSVSGSMGWATEIIDGGDAQAIANMVNIARGRGVQTILRACVGASCGFADPNVYVSFLAAMDPWLTGDVYIIAGPNEPATETWAAPLCGTVAPERPFDYLRSAPCNATYDPEFHSLRPYPIRPCNPNIEQVTLMCANDMYVRQTFEVTPTSPNLGCTNLGEGVIQCDYEIPSVVQVEVDLSNAELPIAGNTQLVPNATGLNAPGLSFLKRMNEYISWYLNGITFRAEEQWQDFGLNNTLSPVDERQPLYQVVNLSGPLKKLYPFEVQNFLTSEGTPPTEVAGQRLEERLQANVERHNQIAVCTAGFSNFPVLCYNSGFPENHRRITDIGFNEGIYGAVRLYSFIPLSSTEDRLGSADTGLAGSQPTNDGVEILNPTILNVGTPQDRQYDNLYFAHMEEDAELAVDVQNLYRPNDIPGFDGNWDTSVDLRAEAGASCEILETRTNPGDDLFGEYDITTNTMTNENPITRQVGYTAKFSCTFYPTCDPACGAAQWCTDAGSCAAAGGTASPGAGYCSNPSDVICSGVPAQPGATCPAGCQRYEPCRKVAMLNMDVNVATPKVAEVWKRLVDGPMSTFKRFYPKFGPGTPIEDDVEDIPTEARASYNATTVSGPAVSTDTLAGDPSKNRSGTAAELYIPHLGGVYDYFLKGIQKALRPLSAGTPLSTPSPTSCTLPTDPAELEALKQQLIAALPAASTECSYNCGNFQFGSPLLKAIIDSAATAFNVPASVMLGIFYNEGGLNGCFPGQTGCKWPNDEAVLAASLPNCQVPSCSTSFTGAQGPWQFLPSTWSTNGQAAIEAGVSDGRTTNVCNLLDSTFAAAKVLSRTSGGWSGYNYPQCLGVTLLTGAGPSTSCNWDNSRTMTAARQYFGLCMDPNNPAAIQEFIDYNYVPDADGDGALTSDDVLAWMDSRNCSPDNLNACHGMSVLRWATCQTP